ncbi:hypothetical protein ACSBR1_034052 [Camellia fascicularis]
MATPFHLPVTAAQVGTYFVGQYYQVLQQQPNFVHQFYNEASTMLRIDGNSRETATAMLNDHDPSKLVAETPCELLRVVIDNNTCKDGLLSTYNLCLRSPMIWLARFLKIEEGISHLMGVGSWMCLMWLTKMGIKLEMKGSSITSRRWCN